MRIFQDLELVEHLGSGIPYIVGLYGRKVFQISKSGLRLSLKFGKSIEKENGKKTTMKITMKTTMKIIEAIKQNPKISAPELSNILGLTVDGINWNLKKLKEQKKIHRIGADRGGYWEVID